MKATMNTVIVVNLRTTRKDSRGSGDNKDKYINGKETK